MFLLLTSLPDNQPANHSVRPCYLQAMGSAVHILFFFPVLLSIRFLLLYALFCVQVIRGMTSRNWSRLLRDGCCRVTQLYTPSIGRPTTLLLASWLLGNPKSLVCLFVCCSNLHNLCLGFSQSIKLLDIHHLFMYIDFIK